MDSKYLEVSPPAAPLIQSLRSIGYTFNAAVSDIIDNSLTANASMVQVKAEFSDESDKPYVAITDNGTGMSRRELINAMSLGSKNPLDYRDSSDLGRFGMGLKSASFSQCLKLICITRKNGKLCGATWDINRVCKKNKWLLETFDREGAQSVLKKFQLDIPNSGTAVIWDNCDKLIPGSAISKKAIERPFGDKVGELKNHLALIFHKFLSEGQKGLKIAVNGINIKPMDPFCTAKSRDYPSSQITIPNNKITCNGQKIKVNGYIIPHESKIKKKQHQRIISLDGDVFNSQGIYIYRGKRLITWGNWARIVSKNDSFKLSRLEIEIPNTLDHVWKLDVKKSYIELPHEIRVKLKEHIISLAKKSKDTFKTRVTIEPPNHSPLWKKEIDPVTKSISYFIDKDNCLVKNLLQDESPGIQRKVERIFMLLELALPITAMANDASTDMLLGRFQNEKLSEKVRTIIDYLKGEKIKEEDIMDYFNNDKSASPVNADVVLEYFKKSV